MTRRRPTRRRRPTLTLRPRRWGRRRWLRRHPRAIRRSAWCTAPAGCACRCARCPRWRRRRGRRRARTR
eukprot:133228-Prymnesium_polylepis.1